MRNGRRVGPADGLRLLRLEIGLGLLQLRRALPPGKARHGGDVLGLLLDVFLLTMFGTALSSCINFWLTTDGQASAVGTIVSAGYGFICGAYMPISNFGTGLQRVLSFLPGTYGTSLLRNHAMGGAFAEMEKLGFPGEVVKAIRDSVDCNLYFFDHQVSGTQMYLILVGSILLLVGLYVVINRIAGRRGAR